MYTKNQRPKKNCHLPKQFGIKTCLNGLILLVLVACTSTPTISPTTVEPGEIARPETVSATAIVISPSPTLTTTLAPSPSSTPTLTLTPIPSPTPVCASPGPTLEGAKLELYGNFHTMGVSVVLPGAIENDPETAMMVEYRTGDQPFHPGFPLSKIGSHRFVGSLFWLEPGSQYDIRVSIVSPGSAIHCHTLEGSAPTRSEVLMPEPTRKYIVSPNGQGNDCNLEVPCALEEGIRQVQPGEAVELRGGVYYTGQIDLPRSGQPGKPIIIRNYANEQAILDGASPDEFTWKDIGDGIYEASLKQADFEVVVANGNRLYRYANMEDLKSLRWELPGFVAHGNRIWIHLTDDANPANIELIISQQPYALRIKQDYIYIHGLTVRHFSQNRYRQAAIQIVGGSYNRIEKSSFEHNNVGIWLRLAAEGNLIQDNRFIDTMTDWAWDAVYEERGATHFAVTGGIRFFSADEGKLLPRGTVIRRNEFVGSFDGLNACIGGDHGWVEGQSPTSEMDVYDNIIHKITDDGLEVDGMCSNIRIWNNAIDHVFNGISFAIPQQGPVYALRNIITRYGANIKALYGLQGPCCGSPFKFTNDELPGKASIYLFHNTAFGALNNRGLLLAEPFSWERLVSRNNIWVGNRRPSLGIRASKNSINDNPIDFDFDNLWGSDNRGRLVIWEDHEEYRDLATFVKQMRVELHGYNLSPGFVNPDSGNYHLSPESPLIDIGLWIPGINDDYYGNAPDLGAFEFGGGL